jgi:hypothetical protein
MDLTKMIIGITLGIRFARSFRIPDISGEIIDNLLYNENSPFGIELFTHVQESSVREKILYNPKTTEYLRLNTDDIILGIQVEQNFKQKYEWIRTKILDYYKDTIFKKYEIKNIVRIGIIFHHKIKKIKELDKYISQITHEKVTDVENINIGFSKKLITREALYRKGVNDYKNTIYQIDSTEEALFVRLDYQYYYKPLIEDLRDCFTDKIVTDAKDFLENQFYSWLSYYEKPKSGQQNRNTNRKD